MVRCLLPFDVHIPAINPFPIKDSLTFLIILYSAKRQGRARAQGMPSLLGKLLRDATAYFLAIFTGHLLIISFEILAPVRGRLTDLSFFPHDIINVGTYSASPRGVSNHLEYLDEGGSYGALPCLQWGDNVTLQITSSSVFD